MSNLGSSDTPIEAQNLGLPAGSSVAEDNGDFVIKDSSGTVVLRRNESAGEWQLGGTDLTGIGSVSADALQIGDSTQVSGGPAGGEGEKIILTTSISSSISEKTSSTDFQDISGISQRTIADYRNISQTNLGTYQIAHGIYALDLPGNGSGLEFRMAGAGDAPGTLENNSTFEVNSTTYRKTHTFGLNPTNFGTWTPLPQLRSTDGNTVQAEGVHTVILSGEIQ